MSVGKSTTGRLLQVLLSNYPNKKNVELITTDNFLFPNETLKRYKLMEKKGFPESYDIHKLIKFVSDLKSGIKKIKTPLYSHFFYDILPFCKIIKNPDIVIIEGLNVLQSSIDYLYDPHHVFISDFVDFSIYIDASESLLKQWYIDRLLKLKKKDFTKPSAYFYNFSLLSDEKLIIIANEFWAKINVKNLKKNILPTKKRANLILTKSFNHIVKLIRLRI